MYYPLTEIKTVEMGEILNVEYTEVTLDERFSKIRRKYQPSFDTRWILPCTTVRRVHFNNYSRSIDERFTAYRSKNKSKVGETLSDNIKSEFEFFKEPLKRRTVLVPRRLVPNNRVYDQDDEPKNGRFFERKSRFLSAGKRYEGLKRKLDEEIDEYMLRGKSKYIIKFESNE